MSVAALTGQAILNDWRTSAWLDYTYLIKKAKENYTSGCPSANGLARKNEEGAWPWHLNKTCHDPSAVT